MLQKSAALHYKQSIVSNSPSPQGIMIPNFTFMSKA